MPGEGVHPPGDQVPGEAEPLPGDQLPDEEPLYPAIDACAQDTEGTLECTGLPMRTMSVSRLWTTALDSCLHDGFRHRQEQLSFHHKHFGGTRQTCMLGRIKLCRSAAYVPQERLTAAFQEGEGVHDCGDQVP